MFSEALFISIFVNNDFGSMINTITTVFPDNSQLLETIATASKIVNPLVANLTATLYIWTFTSMAVAIEAVFAPLLLIPDKISGITTV